MGRNGPSSVFQRCGRNVVWLAAKQTPEPAEWKAYIDLVLDVASAPNAGKSVMVLVVTDGGGPSAVQRTDFVNALKGNRVRTAVLSANTVVRGIATVFNWFNVENKVFAPRDVVGALEFVGIGATARESVWTTVENLAHELGGLDTIQAARPHLRPARDDVSAR
jgi:hypothetical protein